LGAGDDDFELEHALAPSATASAAAVSPTPIRVDRISPP
jgi:hypothetical protein